MAHNTPRDNKEFQLQFCKTNRAYILGGEITPELQKSLDFMNSEICRLETELEGVQV
jgi:hypothetical protein